MNVIVVTKRSDDFHAQLYGKPGIWGCGKNPYEAIGSLINTHPEWFGVNIQRDDMKEPELRVRGSIF